MALTPECRRIGDANKLLYAPIRRLRVESLLTILLVESFAHKAGSWQDTP